MGLLDDPRCAFDLEHLRAWGIMVYVQDFFGRKILLAISEAGAYFEPVELSDDIAVDVALVRLWADIEMHAEAFDLEFRTKREAFGGDPVEVSVADLDGSQVFATMPCDRDSGPFVAHAMLRGLIVDALTDEDVEPLELESGTRWGMQHGIA